jgi:hypothetical protein
MFTNEMTDKLGSVGITAVVKLLRIATMGRASMRGVRSVG